MVKNKTLYNRVLFFSNFIIQLLYLGLTKTERTVCVCLITDGKNTTHPSTANP
jgi:hypothetical protein